MNSKVTNSAPVRAQNFLTQNPQTNVASSNASSLKFKGSIFGKAKNFFTKFTTGDKMPIILIIISIVLLFIIVILYIIFTIRSSKLVGIQLTTAPIKLDELSTPIQILSTLLPPSVVGREFSFSFWVYLDDYNQTIFKIPEIKATSSTPLIPEKSVPLDKMIFYRGDADNISTANPIVYMDGLSNKMNIAIKTQGSTLSNSTLVDYNKNLYNIKFMNYFMNSSLKNQDLSVNKYIILTIDYIPLQRWVNITFIIDNKISTVFMDGEIYSVKSTEEFKILRDPELNSRGEPLDINLITDNINSGNIYIGKNTVGGNNTISGYLGKLQYFNYAMGINEVKNSYSYGPIGKNTIAGISIPYSVRSPIYKLE